MLLLQSAAFSTQLEDGELWRVVDEDGCFGQRGDLGIQLLPLVFCQVARAQFVGSERGFGRDQTCN